MLFAQWYLNELVCMSSSLPKFSTFIHSNGLFLVVCMRTTVSYTPKSVSPVDQSREGPLMVINNKVLISNVQVHFEVLV